MGNVAGVVQSAAKLRDGEKSDLLDRILLGCLPLADDVVRIYLAVRDRKTAVLQVDREEANQVYKRLRLLLHPDKCRIQEATDAFQRLTSSWERVEAAEGEYHFRVVSGGRRQPQEDGEWDDLWARAFNAGMRSQRSCEVEACRFADYMICHCVVAVGDLPTNHDVAIADLQAVFSSVDSWGRQKTAALVSAISDKLFRVRGPAPPLMRDWAYNLVLDTLAKERWKILFERKQLQDPTYTLHQFYMEHPDHRPLDYVPSQASATPAPPPSRLSACLASARESGLPSPPGRRRQRGRPVTPGCVWGFPPGAREQQEEEEESGGEGQSRPRKRGRDREEENQSRLGVRRRLRRFADRVAPPSARVRERVSEIYDDFAETAPAAPPPPPPPRPVPRRDGDIRSFFAKV
eukprot:jgi/Mesvir1/10189/Mv05731-RA.1